LRVAVAAPRSRRSGPVGNVDRLRCRHRNTLSIRSSLSADFGFSSSAIGPLRCVPRPSLVLETRRNVSVVPRSRAASNSLRSRMVASMPAFRVLTIGETQCVSPSNLAEGRRCVLLAAPSLATSGGFPSPSSDRNRGHSSQTVIIRPSTLIRNPTFGLAPCRTLRTKTT
jgi:hypothetical protein